jgi:hypothetical protein
MESSMIHQAMETLYAGLDAGELRSVAACCSLSIEDVRQEAQLLCWCIASGQCDFDPAQGTPRQYIMGRLWGLTLRYQVSLSLTHSHDEESPEVESPWARELLLSSPHVQEPLDPLTELVAREDEREKEDQIKIRKQKLMAGLNARDRTFAEMLLAAPIDQVAALYGLTVRAARYRQVELLKQLEVRG